MARGDKKSQITTAGKTGEDRRTEKEGNGESIGEKETDGGMKLRERKNGKMKKR